MVTLEQEMRELLDEFLASGEERAAEFDATMRALESAAADGSHLADLRRHFHRLSGAGAIYDVVPLMALGRRGEDLVTLIADEGRLPTAAEAAYCRQLVDQVRTEFERQRARLDEAPPAPLAVVAGRAAGPEPVKRFDHGAQAADILVVDGDPAVRQRLVGLLAHDGITSVRTAESREAAVAEVDRALPDGAIVAHGLPDGTGVDVVRHIRQCEQAARAAVGLREDDFDATRARRMPVLLVAPDGFLDNTEAIRAGADACFDKPADSEWEAIVRRLHRLLERDGEQSRVLLVEDDTHQSRKIRHVLESVGYLTRVCESPRNFDEVLAEFRPDLILMDIDLPEVSGLDLAKYVRQEDQYITMPILFLSSDTDERARIDSVLAGGDAHLTKPVRQEVLIANVAARLERARFIRTLLNRDGLTRLLTHTSFMEQAQSTVARKRRERGLVSLAMIDIDHFKSVNDTYGHQAGDRVLVSLAGLLRRALRRSDVVGRYGGEEFGVLLDDLDEQGATGLLMRLLHDFSTKEHRAPDGSLFRVTFSAGVATFDPVGMDLQRWIEAADASLYAAKRGGRNRVVTNRERMERLRIGA
ncbi:MAG: diguanylate cyclase [Vicinamibacterales bacterium]|nr:diguanylate cyclase [Vicinamibacterales bacterium]